MRRGRRIFLGQTCLIDEGRHWKRVSMQNFAHRRLERQPGEVWEKQLLARNGLSSEDCDEGTSHEKRRTV